MTKHLISSWYGDSPRATGIARGFIGEVLNNGDIAVDATAGNGNDTLFLANAVGDKGKVYAFDIQKEALDKTAKRLQEQNLKDRVVLLQKSHEHIEDIIDKPLKAAMFNLGYLPGGNNEIVTLTETTLSAVKQGLSLLTHGGRLSIVVYRGHPGAMEESTAVDSLMSSIEPDLYWVARITFPNINPKAPYILLIQKKTT